FFLRARSERTASVHTPQTNPIEPAVLVSLPAVSSILRGSDAGRRVPGSASRPESETRHKGGLLRRAALLDHAVSSSNQRNRGLQPQGFGSLQTYEQLHPCRELNGEISRLLTLQDASGVDAGMVVGVLDITPIAHRAAGRDEIAILIDRRELRARQQITESILSR